MKLNNRGSLKTEDLLILMELVDSVYLGHKTLTAEGCETILAALGGLEVFLESKLESLK